MHHTCGKGIQVAGTTGGKALRASSPGTVNSRSLEYRATSNLFLIDTDVLYILYYSLTYPRPLKEMKNVINPCIMYSFCIY